MKTYLFYDIETTGLNPCFDQVLEFAAIRTDLELRELERYEFKIKLNPETVPSPAAMITHQISLEQIGTGVTEYSAMIKIHQLLNTPGTISLGYNTLGFDDEFLRFSFYRNLLPPYTHQYANQCSRMDLYPFAVMYYLFKPSVLKVWPQHNQQISLKLANLSEANRLAQGAAHTAIVDVEATLALAREFFRERKIWDYLTGFFDKDTDLRRMTPLSEAILVNGKLGAKHNFSAPVLPLGRHEHYKNQTLWLRLDLDNLSQLTPENIPTFPGVIRKKTGEHKLLLPMEARYLASISSERQQLAQRNKTWLNENPELLSNLSAYHRQYTYPKMANIDADAALYEIKFPTSTENSLFQKFHYATPENKPLIAHQFPNPVHRELAQRICGRHFYESLPHEHQQTFNQYVTDARHGSATLPANDFRGQYRLTISKALLESTELTKTNLSTHQQHLLQQLSAWFES